MEPKIRFKGFEGEWKEAKLGDIATFSKGSGYSKSDLCKEGSPIVLYGRLYTKYQSIIDEIDTFVAPKANSVISTGGEVIIPASGESPEDISLAATIKNAGVIIGGDLNVLKFDYNNNNSAFMSMAITYSPTRSELSNYSQGKTVVHLRNSEIAKGNVCFPRIEEQKAIVNYVLSLDSQISAATSRLASLKQMKAASLQALFPQEGETVPKIRFKGFEGEWKTCVLSSIATMHARIGWQNLRKDEFLSSGDYYLITGTDFHDGKISFETCHYIDKERYDQDKNIQLETDSILITKDGTLGKVAFVDSLDKPATLNAGVFNVKTKDKEIYPKYLFQYLKAPYLMDYVNKNATGGTIKHLNQNMLVNFPVQHPSYKEQVMIGDYLFNLDRQISLQSQRLEKLKQIKSACLDKMFV